MPAGNPALARDFSLDPGAFDVTVRSGIVTITGLVGSRAMAVRLIGALGHAEGVVDVRDRLSFLPGRPSFLMAAGHIRIALSWASGTVGAARLRRRYLLDDRP